MANRDLYRVTRVFAYPRETLWKAWTSTEALQQWYHPVELTAVAESAKSIAEVGGKWSIGIDASAFGYVPYFYGRYLEVTTFSKLRHTMHYTESPEDFAVADETTDFHEVIITFSEVSGGTEVTFVQCGTLPDGQAEQARAGMESYFDSLSAYLDAQTT